MPIVEVQFREIEAMSGQSCGNRPTGGVYLAAAGRAWIWQRNVHGPGRYLGLKTEIVTPEAAALFLLLDKRHFVGASCDRGNAVVGWVTSCGFARCSGTSVALAYVPADRAGDGGAGAFQVEILGVRPPATIAPRPLFDPEGARMRS